MHSLSVSQARADLYRLVDDVSSSHQPTQITGKRASAVLVAQEDWEAVQETMHLLSIRGMRESIVEGLETPLSDTDTRPGW